MWVVSGRLWKIVHGEGKYTNKIQFNKKKLLKQWFMNNQIASTEINESRPI